MQNQLSNKLPEEEIISRLLKKDRSALEYLYDSYSAALMGVIFRIVKNEETAEEVLQDAFVKFWLKIQSYDESKGKLFTWMINIARNLAIDKIRSKNYKKGQKTYRIENSVYSFLSTNTTEKNTDGIGVRELAEMLTDDQKLVLDLVYFQGYTQSEVAKEYNIPLGTVKTRLRAALLVLRKRLKKPQ